MIFTDRRAFFESPYEIRLPILFTTALEIKDIDERIRIRLLDARMSRVIAIYAPAYPLRKGKKSYRRPP